MAKLYALRTKAMGSSCEGPNRTNMNMVVSAGGCYANPTLGRVFGAGQVQCLGRDKCIPFLFSFCIETSYVRGCSVITGFILHRYLYARYCDSLFSLERWDSVFVRALFSSVFVEASTSFTRSISESQIPVTTAFVFRLYRRLYRLIPASLEK